MSCQVKVIETTLTIQQNILSVFHVIIQSPQSKISLVRYPFDFTEFHQKVRTYYPKSKISFPTLQNPRHHAFKRRSFQNLLPRKSNAEKIQKYLDHCFRHPALSLSSILYDFTRVQRDEDAVLSHSSVNCLDLMKDTPPLPVTPEDFDLIKVLGRGCMGKILLVKSKKDNHHYALKSIPKKQVLIQKELKHIRAERDILVCLRNQPFLVHLHHVFQSQSTLFLLLDYHPGGDLAAQLSIHYKFSPEQTLFYAAEIVQGLEILHKHGIVYRDLKPENVLISKDGHVVLADFGLSKIFTPQEMDQEDAPLTHTFCGTAEYLAPEILLGEPYTFVVDFWSLGTLLFEMLTGITPFWAENHMDMYRRVIEDPLEFNSCDQNTFSFLSGLLEKEADQRLGWGENGIQEIKKHSYFKSIDWNRVICHEYMPPYVPAIAKDADVSHFDEAFTSMPARISQSSIVEQDPFVLFDYNSLLDKFQKSRLRKHNVSPRIDCS